MKLELRGITKRFGDFTANDKISFTVHSGEIHALLGENGAGKSTLMNVLYGLLHAEEGEILIDDVPQHFSNPGDSMAAGIGMVHQHFMLVPVFTVAQNVVLGNEPTSAGGIIDLGKAREKVKEISDRFGFEVDPDALVEDLPVGVQQRVEIIKALSRDAEILILDEPSAVLTPQETDELMKTMLQLKNEGKIIIFITHKLREIKEVADVVTVIRRGKVVDTVSPKETQEKLAELMVGRAVLLNVHKEPQKYDEVLLKVENLSLIGEKGVPALNNVSFEVKKGEILSIAGVQGNGQTELAEVLLGLTKPTSGEVTLGNIDLTHKSVKQTLSTGVGYIPEDRNTDGLVGDFTLPENLVLDQSDVSPFAKWLNLNLPAINSNAINLIKQFDIRAGSAHSTASQLSGGNQQKVVVARELSRDLKLLVAAQPTRGVDVGSIEFIHQQIVNERDKGIPVVVISTELDEVSALADRIAVMFHGKIIGIVPGDTDRNTLGLMMAGIPPEQARKEA